jgi:hypothetical protein
MIHAWTVWFAADLCPVAPVVDPDWLTAPRATVIAACLALLAAAGAYLGVMKTVRSTQRESRRKERLDALVEGAAALRNLTLPLIRLDRAGRDPHARAEVIRIFDVDRFSDLNNLCGLANTKLQLYGFDDVLDAVGPVMAQDIRVMDKLRDNPGYRFDSKQFNESFATAMTAFKEAIAKLK